MHMSFFAFADMYMYMHLYLYVWDGQVGSIGLGGWDDEGVGHSWVQGAMGRDGGGEVG